MLTNPSQTRAGISPDRYAALMQHWQSRSHKRSPLHRIAAPVSRKRPAVPSLTLGQWAAEFGNALNTQDS